MPQPPQRGSEPLEAPASGLAAAIRQRPALVLIAIGAVAAVLGGMLVGLTLGLSRNCAPTPAAPPPVTAPPEAPQPPPTETSDVPPAAPTDPPQPTKAVEIPAAVAAPPVSDADVAPPTDGEAPWQVEIDTVPTAVAVLVDNLPVGKSPVTLTLEPGRRTLRLLSDSKQLDYTKTVKVKQGARRIELIVPKARLIIQSKSTRATVYVDGHKMGETPLEPLNLYAGQHRLKLEHAALQRSGRETVTLEPGETTTVTVELTSDD